MRAPDGTVTVDPTGRAAGRGAYLCNDPACFETAARRRALEHALGVPLPADLVARLAGGTLISERVPTIPGTLFPASGGIPDSMPRGDTHGQE